MEYKRDKEYTHPSTKILQEERIQSNTKYAKNVDNTEMNDGSKEWLKLETKTGQNS